MGRFYSKQEQLDLYSRYKDGDQHALELLVESIKPLRESCKYKAELTSNGLLSVEDVEEIEAKALTNTVLKFEVSKDVKFNTFYTFVFNNERLMGIRNKTSEKGRMRSSFCCLDSPVGISLTSGSTAMLHDLIEDEDDEIGCFEIQETVRNVSLDFDERDRGIIDLHVQGYTQNEIGEAFGLTQKSVHLVLAIFKRNFKEQYEGVI